MLTLAAVTKAEAIRLFDDKVAALAAALGVSPQAVYQWPAVLPQARADQVVGAALRLGRLPGCRCARARPDRRSASR